MIKPEYFLEKYNIVFEGTDSVEEKMRKMIALFGVHESYRGNKPYIFVSYAHKDSPLVLPAIKTIQDAGYPVWFDAGISPGSEWAADISRHLKNASLVLAFVSNNAFESNNCRAEIVYAFGHRKPMLTVRLDNTPLPDGLDMQLSLSQMFDAFAYDDGDEFVTRLSAAAIISEHIRPVMLEEYAEMRRKAEEAERQRQAEEAARLRRVAEEAERQRKAAQKAEEELREAEAAERKYQQAKEEARKRREAEEAQQKRWEEESLKQERQKHPPKETTASEAKEAQARKTGAQEQVKQADKAYGRVESALIAHDYRNAIGWFNDKVQPIEAAGPEAQARVGFLRDKLSDRLYRDAGQMERDRRTRQEAGLLYRALPRDHRDASVRGERLRKKYARRETVWGIALSVLYFGAHVGFSRFVLHLLPWYFDILVMLVPMLLVCGMSVLETKAFYGTMDTFTAIMMFEMAISCVMDAFLFQGIGIWGRILWTLCFTAVSFLIWVITGAAFFAETNKELPKIK